MNLALIGHGRMGKTVERLAREEGHQVVAIFTGEQPVRCDHVPPETDVFIDFSAPGAVPQTVAEVCRTGRPIVIGTTGWYRRLPEVQELVTRAGIGAIYAPNFALGVNLFFKLAETAARLFGPHGFYDCCIHEIHHAGKVDSPSGTALRLAEIVRENWPGKTELLVERPRDRIGPHQLHVSSSRCGYVLGEHTLIIDSPDDTVELRHRTRSRDVFARGALRAAQWIMGKKGLFTMDDMLSDLIGKVMEGSDGHQ